MSSADVHDLDLLIVGAGPAGLYGAYYAGFRGLRVGIMDSLPQPGGQVSAMYPEKQIFDVAGFPAVKGADLVAGLVEQAASADPHYLLGHRAETCQPQDDGRLLVGTGEGGPQVLAKAVVVTGGIGSFTPRPLPAGGEFDGRGLVYFVPHLDDHAGKDVVIVGGGDSAFDWALALHGIANSVTLVHRRDAFRAHARTVEQVKQLDVRLITSAQVAALRGEHLVTEVELTLSDGSTEVLPAQTVVAALGFIANLGPLKTWGLEIRGNRHIVVDTTMATAIPGVFAAGDITDYPGKVRLIAVGFGEVATAVNNAAVFIDPSAHLFPGHSSNDGETAGVD